MLNKPVIIVRGAGELGSAVALTLNRVGYPVILTERSEPLAIRRPVTFSDAVFTGTASVEEITAVRTIPSELDEILHAQAIPLIVTDDLPDFHFPVQALIDARMLKDSGITRPSQIPWVIGLGPGFEVGRNCDVIIETQRGHDLGRVLWHGCAATNSGVPGEIGGESRKRVIYSPIAGQVKWGVDFGKMVQAGQPMGRITADHIITAPISGLVRGLISPLVTVKAGVKIGDVDPRGSQVSYQRISEKARNIARGVLEALLMLENNSFVERP
ncbi:MAG: EF2563 family selenium-dependent molybdenum hydroxylase system protein [Lentisphaeria bacterium]|nr:EF2563 family selenium-dependent molybdenum hydroxylase system protein [Candidatus Neomarinimicrobiota bacterium]MCF7841479.1 EF2563 family selenium-dependent molybdenum hydroxylase system protein [Lentisphaeria bacterium]